MMMENLIQLTPGFPSQFLKHNIFNSITKDFQSIQDCCCHFKIWYPFLFSLRHNFLRYFHGGAFWVAQWQRICLPMQETWVWSLGQEDPPKKEMITHSSNPQLFNLKRITTTYMGIGKLVTCYSITSSILTDTCLFLLTSGYYHPSLLASLFNAPLVCILLILNLRLA